MNASQSRVILALALIGCSSNSTQSGADMRSPDAKIDGGSSGTAGGAGAAAKDLGTGGAPYIGSGGATSDSDAGKASDIESGDASASNIDGGGTSTGSCRACTAYAEPVLRARVGVAALNALSGAALSVGNPGVIFAHNDHDRPVVYALGDGGREITRIALPGAPATDIEDMAVGACPAGTCVYLADIGDNAEMRDEYAILRFTEPIIDADALSTMDAPFERFAFAYEDGSHNAEGLLVPPSGNLYIVTKLRAGNPSAVYKLTTPLSNSQTNVAVKVAELPVPMPGDDLLCAADAHPCGLGFIVRTYNTVYEFRIARGAAFESAFAADPQQIRGADEPQSEAIAYLPDGSGFITSGEGDAAPIYATLCE